MSSVFIGAGADRDLRPDLKSAIRCAVDLFQMRQFHRSHTDEDLFHTGVVVALANRNKLEPLEDRAAACYLFGMCRYEFLRNEGAYSRNRQKRKPKLRFCGNAFWAVQSEKEKDAPSAPRYLELVAFTRKIALSKGRGRRSALKDRVVAATLANTPRAIVAENEGVTEKYVKSALEYTVKRVRREAAKAGLL